MKPAGLILLGSAFGLGVLAIAASAGASSGSPPKGKRFSKSQLVDLAREHGFPDSNLAAAIAMGESGGNPTNVNNSPPREISVGLWQINTLAWHKYTREELYDPDTNAKAAYEISKGGKNWHPWGAYTNGSYLSFL